MVEKGWQLGFFSLCILHNLAAEMCGFLRVGWARRVRRDKGTGKVFPNDSLAIWYWGPLEMAAQSWLFLSEGSFANSSNIHLWGTSDYSSLSNPQNFSNALLTPPWPWTSSSPHPGWSHTSFHMVFWTVYFNIISSAPVNGVWSPRKNTPLSHCQRKCSLLPGSLVSLLL